MDAAIFTGRLLLGLVFFSSGLLKVFDLKGTVASAKELGVPRVAAAAVGLGLPWIEIGLSVCLFIPGAADGAAVAVGLLLLVFSCLAAISILRGRRPKCRCFGQLSDAPISWRTIIRNTVLEGVAIFLILAAPEGTGQFSGWRWTSSASDVAYVGLGLSAVLLLGVLVLALLAVQLIAQQGRILIRLDSLENGGPHLSHGGASLPKPPQLGLPLGFPAPSFELPDVYGETLTLESALASGRPIFLTFMDPDCGPCNTLLPELARWQREFQDRYTFLAVNGGSSEQNRAKMTEHQLTGMIVLDERTFSTKFQAHGTPSAVIISADGRIDSHVAEGADEIRELITTRAERISGSVQPGGENSQPHSHPQKAAYFGKPVPDVVVKTLDGQTVPLAGLLTNRTVILFWNPTCGFCRQMLDRLKSWEASANHGQPDLVVVSAGDSEANRAMGLRSRVLLDDSFALGQALGAQGTPSAVLLSRSGLVHSTLMVGAEAVMSLLHERAQEDEPIGAGSP